MVEKVLAVWRKLEGWRTLAFNATVALGGFTVEVQNALNDLPPGAGMYAVAICVVNVVLRWVTTKELKLKSILKGGDGNG